MRHYQKIPKDRLKIKCMRCNKFKYVKYKNNFRGKCICDDCVGMQNLNYNRQFFIPRRVCEMVGFSRGDLLKLVVNKNKTLTIKLLKKADKDKTIQSPILSDEDIEMDNED